MKSLLQQLGLPQIEVKPGKTVLNTFSSSVQTLIWLYSVSNRSPPAGRACSEILLLGKKVEENYIHGFDWVSDLYRMGMRASPEQ